MGTTSVNFIYQSKNYSYEESNSVLLEPNKIDIIGYRKMNLFDSVENETVEKDMLFISYENDVYGTETISLDSLVDMIGSCTPKKFWGLDDVIKQDNILKDVRTIDTGGNILYFKTPNLFIKDDSHNAWAIFNTSAKQIMLGDMYYSNNQTRLVVNDLAANIFLKASNGITFTSDVLAATFKTTNLTGNVNLQIPNANNKTLAVSLNGNYADVNGNMSINIPSAQVQSDWNATSGLGVILNKPNIAPNEGTYLPNATSISGGTYTQLSFRYMKIGTTVFIWGSVEGNHISGSFLFFVLNLPFPVSPLSSFGRENGVSYTNIQNTSQMQMNISGTNSIDVRLKAASLGGVVSAPFRIMYKTT
jgi:hypothetical protein